MALFGADYVTFDGIDLVDPDVPYSVAEFRVRLNLFDLQLAGKDHGAAEECLGHLTRIASHQQASAPKGTYQGHPELETFEKVV